MSDTKNTPPRPTPSEPRLDDSPCSPLEALSNLLDMPAENIRSAAKEIRAERKRKRLMEKLRLIRERNTAIMPTGEIVSRETPGAMPYDSPENDQEDRTRAGDDQS